MKKLKFGDAVRVYWLDSSVQEGWQRTPPKDGTGQIVTLGYVIESSLATLVISHSIEKSGPFLSTLSIPRGAIVSVEKLKELTR